MVHERTTEPGTIQRRFQAGLDVVPRVNPDTGQCRIGTSLLRQGQIEEPCQGDALLQEHHSQVHVKIMVVEDDDILLRLLLKKIGGMGFDTRGVSSGAEAIKQIAVDPPDLLLVDYYLSDMTGEELIQTLADLNQRLPFIVITGQGDERVAVSMMKLGARDYLVKDTTFLDQLPRTLKSAMSQLENEKKLAKMEEALRQSESTRNAMLSAIPDMMVQIREDGTCLEFIPGLNSVLHDDSRMSLDITLIDLMLSEVAGNHMNCVQQALLTGEIQVAQYQLEVNGKSRDYEARYAASGPNEVLAMVRDITEQKQAEEMQLEIRESEELSNLKTNILSTVSHELRTPLAVIKGYSTMLVEYAGRLETEEQRDYLDTIDKAADRLTELVGHLLDISRLDAGLLRLFKKPISIGEIAEEAVAQAWVKVPSHRIVLSQPASDMMLNVDGGRIRQVIDNIIDNAIKYSGEGTTVTVAVEEMQTGLRVSVADEGIGIPSEDLVRVFDRMYRIEQRLAEDPSGLGLGLALCKALVEAHGGQIWVESTAGQGSTFYFTLPLIAEDGL